MEITTVLLILRIAACLGGGFWLARQLRGVIPAIVLRLMPAKHRFSENAFRIQTRISTIVAVVVTLGGAALLHQGINWVAAQVRTQTRTQISPQPPKTPVPMAIPQEVAEDYEWPPARPERYEDPTPSPTAPAPAPKTGDWCLQLHALTDEDNARQQQARLSRALSRPVQLSYLQGDIGPYKLYIAGFGSRDEALRFAKKHGLSGFPRPAHQLHAQPG